MMRSMLLLKKPKKLASLLSHPASPKQMGFPFPVLGVHFWLTQTIQTLTYLATFGQSIITLVASTCKTNCLSPWTRVPQPAQPALLITSTTAQGVGVGRSHTLQGCMPLFARLNQTSPLIFFGQWL